MGGKKRNNCANTGKLHAPFYTLLLLRTDGAFCFLSFHIHWSVNNAPHRLPSLYYGDRYHPREQLHFLSTYVNTVVFLSSLLSKYKCDVKLCFPLIRGWVKFLEAYNFVTRCASCKRIHSRGFWDWIPPLGYPVGLFIEVDVLTKAMSFLRWQEGLDMVGKDWWGTK